MTWSSHSVPGIANFFSTIEGGGWEKSEILVCFRGVT